MTPLLLPLLYLTAQSLSSLSAEGAAAMRAKEYADAARIYQTLVARDAGSPMWKLNLGMALFYAEQHQNAAKALEDFLRAKPEPGPGHLFLGVSRLKLQQPCEAIAPLEAALLWPQRPQSRWTELADAYQGCKRWEPAARAYAEAAKLDPKDFRLTRQSAHCWRMARQYETAKPLFASLEKQYGENAEFQFEFGDTLMRIEGAQGGIAWLEKSVAKDPALVPARGALGRALLELGRSAEAIPHLEIASKTDAAALLPLSRAYRAVGRIEDAATAEAVYKSRIAPP
jgi:predicted Zn-dependent protease